MRIACSAALAFGIVAFGACGGSVSTTEPAGGGNAGTGASSGKGGNAGVGGAGGSSAGSGGAAGIGGYAGTGGQVPDASPETGTVCYSNDACAPNEWCDLEPAPQGMCASGGKGGVCKPRPKPEDCPDYDTCPGVCGCNGTWYCDACEAHVYGISITASSTWCKVVDASKTCGGKMGLPCSADEYCDYPPGEPCGWADGTGICMPRPSCPDPGGSGACGCDGQYYLSECSAHAAGVDDTGGLECAPDAASYVYTSHAWFGGLDHIMIYRADVTNNTCLVLALARPYSETFGLSLPSEWGVQNAMITDSAADCSGTGPGGKIVQAASGSGAVLFYTPDGGFFPCTLDVHAAFKFDQPPAWVQPVETMDAYAVVVEGGCQ